MPFKDLRRQVLNKVANANTLIRILDIGTDPAVADRFATKISNHIRYSTDFKYDSDRQEVISIVDQIRSTTRTRSSLRDDSPDSDDSGFVKGKKTISPRIQLGDEVRLVFGSNILFQVASESDRVEYVHAIIEALDIPRIKLREWGFRSGI